MTTINQEQARSELAAMRADVASATTLGDLQQLADAWDVTIEGDTMEAQRAFLEGYCDRFAAECGLAVSPSDRAARIANLIQPFYQGMDHLGKHVYFRTRDAANEWRDACGWDYVLETTPGRIWRATQKPI